jgi:hypothetical protein
VTTLVDMADWSGIAFETNGIGGQLSYRGNTYANEYEVLLAKLLHHLKVPFTPHVRILLDYPDGRQRPYHPDFLFDGLPYVWTSPKNGHRQVIHGIEAKSRASGSLEPEKKRLLMQQRRINMLILDNRSIERFHEQRYLPLAPFIP